MLLDTTFLIDLLDRLDAADHRLDELIEDSTPIGVSVLSVYETGIGLADHERERFDSITEQVTVVPLRHDDTRRALSIQRTLFDRGQRIGDIDAMIAATAAERDETVLTRNVDEFERVEAITVETY